MNGRGVTWSILPSYHLFGFCRVLPYVQRLIRIQYTERAWYRERLTERFPDSRIHGFTSSRLHEDTDIQINRSANTYGLIDRRIQEYTDSSTDGPK